ncbi:hypothetical protein HY798_04935 [Candidatus Falkowbacteria bacterium]|nr:hypothetical protein [Candidatus Falkowbacteria bacterium]
MLKSGKIEAKIIIGVDVMINKSKQLVEKFLDSESKKATAIKFLLAVIAIAGVGFLGASMAGAFKTAGRYRYSRRFSKRQLIKAREKLKEAKLIKFIKKENGKIKAELTNKGKKRIGEFPIDALTIVKPKKWDGKWRVLLFDVPSKPLYYNEARRALREKIKELGFMQLQKSAWIYPYECEDEILFIAETYNIQKYIEMLRVESLLGENKLKREFNLG